MLDFTLFMNMYNRLVLYEDQVSEIYRLYGTSTFTYHDLKGLKDYTYRAHHALINDGAYELVGLKRRPPHTYRLSSKVITFLEKRLS